MVQQRSSGTRQDAAGRRTLFEVYWGLAQVGARGRLLRATHYRPLDAGDRSHDRW